MNNDDKKERLQQLHNEVAQLENELKQQPDTWESGQTGYYGMYHATSGLMLGSVGAIVSLLFNVVGSLITHRHPLRLIQVYLTFPLGEKSLTPEFDTGIVLAVGCCLYIGTGMILGIPFQMAIARFMPNANLTSRMLLATFMGLILWGVNFYGILSWLQPLLIGGDWIVDPSVLPPWVGAATHLVFAWTMAIIYPWGKYQPYRRPSQSATAT